MVKHVTERRALLLVAGAAAVAAAAGPAAGQSTEISGEVTFEGGAAIPKGQIEVYLDDRAVQDNVRRRTGETRIESDGRSRAIAFSLSQPATSTASATLQIVARLERLDGWLVARGSVQYRAGSPVHVKLKTVMY